MSETTRSLESYVHAVEDSTVLDLNETDLRLTWLGIRQLVDPGGASESSLAELTARIDKGRGVLSNRAQVRRAEAELSAASSRTRAGANVDADEIVKIRFGAALLTQAVAALEAFQERENPSLESFGRDKGKLIDPPEKVAKTLRKYRLALETLERKRSIAAAESDLLS